MLPTSVHVADDTVHYRVTGRTVAELGRQLGVDRGSTSDSDYIGATAAQLRWEFTQRRAGDSCTITSVAVFLTVQTRLPAWSRPPKPPPTLVHQWDDFLAATERHEEGHRNIALHTAAAIARTLADERGLPCAELDEMANASANAQWELGNQHQLAYDAATRHGVMQGSRWPPFVTTR